MLPEMLSKILLSKKKNERDMCVLATIYESRIVTHRVLMIYCFKKHNEVISKLKIKSVYTWDRIEEARLFNMLFLDDLEAHKYTKV